MAQYPGFAAIIAAYVAGLPAVVANLKDLIERNDLHSLRRLAHQQRGAGGGYGFEAITEIAGRLEDAINTHEASEEIHRNVEDLTDLLRRVDGYVELT